MYDIKLAGMRSHIALLAAVGVVFVWSLIGCHDFFTWFLEVAPAIIGIAVLIAIYPRFRFTTMVYVFIAIHAAILMVGGHYTYQRMPLFDWLKQRLQLDRNYYDRLGHFAQGFVPTLIAREVLLRQMLPGKMLSFLVFSICMAISACTSWSSSSWRALAAAPPAPSSDRGATRGIPSGV